MAALVSMREAYGEALVELGRAKPEIVVLSADVSNSDFSCLFQLAFPDRFFNVGIAEACLVDVAAGFASCGMIPFANTFAFLFATRALDGIRTHLCQGGLNVKLMGAYAGLSDSFDGPSHNSVTDVAIMRTLPRMTVVVPSDPMSIGKLLSQVAEWPGPVYVRLCRNDVPVLFGDSYQPFIGRAVRLRSGSSVTLVCCGVMVARTLEAAEVLEGMGVTAEVLEMHTVKPLDEPALLASVEKTRAAVTIEEHSVLGGLGGAVAEVLASSCPVPLRRVGLRDCFAETGPYLDLLDRYGMSVEDIVSAAREAVEAKEERVKAP